MPSITKVQPIIDLNQIKTHSLNSLVDIFQQISQDEPLKHLLILDKSISKYINRLTPFSNLKSLTNIASVIWLEDTIDINLVKESRSVVLLSKDSLSCIELISTIIKTKILPLNQKITLSVIFASSNKKTDNLIIESLNLKGDLDVYNWDKLKPVQLADDLISLEQDDDLKNLYQYKSISSITKLSETLLDLVIMSNYKLRITNTYAKGELSQNFLQDYQKNFEVYKSSMNANEKKLLDDIDDCLFLDKHTFYNKQCDLVVLERSVDMISPLLTQLTYMGLIDEFYDIDLNEIEIIEPSTNNKTRIAVDDELISNELKDLNFSQVGPILNTKAKHLQEEFESRHSATDIKQIQKFVDKLNDLTAQQNLVKNHTLIAEDILNKVKTGDDEDEENSYFNTFIDLQQQIISNNYDNTTNCSKILEFMYVFKPSLVDILRLVILTTIVKKGIRQKEYHTLQKEIIECFGFKVFTTLRTLNELKLFYIRESNSDNFTSLFTSSLTDSSTTTPTPLTRQYFNPSAQLIKDFSQVEYFLNLIPTDVEEGQEPDFALPGFIPIVARLVQSIYSRDFTPSSTMKLNSNKPGWKKLNETLNKNMDGPLFKETILVPDEKRKIFESAVTKGKRSKEEEEYIILVMIGGITYAELTTVRFIINKINKDLGYNKKLLVLTSNVIKNDDIVKMCM